MIVTIDGPAGAGKSTAARGLAKRLGFEFLDTGAMYRAVAYWCLRKGVDPNHQTAVASLAQSITIRFDPQRVLVNGVDVTRHIRTNQVTLASRQVAANAAVREHLGKLQRAMAGSSDIVTEGRDQGTAVFPDAACKFFLTAESTARALRRRQDMQQRGENLPLETILAEQEDRDRRDQSRAVGPLKPAPDARHVDTTNLSRDEVVDVLVSVVRDSVQGI